MSGLTTSTDPASMLTRGRRWAALVVLTASLLVITMDMTILNVALPELAADLRPTSDQQLWIVDIYSLVLAGLLVSVSATADRWGRKRMLILGYAVFAAASLLVLFAESAGAVIAIRALLGVGGAMIMPTTLSMIRVTFTDLEERATALSIWAAVSGLGLVVGPLVGGILGSRESRQDLGEEPGRRRGGPVCPLRLVRGSRTRRGAVGHRSRA